MVTDEKCLILLFFWVETVEIEPFRDEALLPYKGFLIIIMGGRHSTEVASALLTQPTRVGLPVFPKFFLIPDLRCR